MKTFKHIMNLLLSAKTDAEKCAAAAEIDGAFQAGKITFKDHELLYKLVQALNPECTVIYEDFGW